MAAKGSGHLVLWLITLILPCKNGNYVLAHVSYHCTEDHVKSEALAKPRELRNSGSLHLFEGSPMKARQGKNPENTMHTPGRWL